MVEPRRPVTPPVRGRPPATRRQILVRRALALVVLLAGGVFLVWIAVAALGAVGGEEEAAPTVTTPPPPKPLRIIFPEGFTRREMARRIAAVNEIALEKRKTKPLLSPQRYMRLTADSPIPAEFAGDGKRRSLEGFLFPATYEFTAKTTTQQLIDKQLSAFRRNWAKIDLSYARSKNLTPYDVLIIASMIEKETLAPEERPLVAAVIYNRLKAGMALQIDATVRYGLGVPPTESLRVSHLESDNPYNTRKFAGLTPTPFANPVLASMQAAAHPKRVNYLYFVRKPDKVHYFFTASPCEFEQYLAEHGYGN